jgi:hypothetical protein
MKRRKPLRIRPPQLRRLARDLLRLRQRSPADALSHAECEEMLAWYTSDEQARQDVRNLYPTVWRHLQTCDRCAQSYELLKFALEAGPRAESPPRFDLATKLSFLSDRPFETWRLEKSSPLFGNKPRVGFRLQPAYIRQVLATPRYAFSRDRGEQVPELLLLQDEMPLGQHLVTVSAWLVRSPLQTDLASIRFQIASQTRLGKGLTAHLRWGDQDYMTPVVDSRGRFESIVVPDFADAKNLGECRLNFAWSGNASEEN